VSRDFVPAGTVTEPGWLIANHEDNQPRAEEAARFVESVIGPRD
jgi:hypothetical protein